MENSDNPENKNNIDEIVQNRIKEISKVTDTDMKDRAYLNEKK